MTLYSPHNRSPFTIPEKTLFSRYPMYYLPRYYYPYPHSPPNHPLPSHPSTLLTSSAKHSTHPLLKYPLTHPSNLHHPPNHLFPTQPPPLPSIPPPHCQPPIPPPQPSTYIPTSHLSARSHSVFHRNKTHTHPIYTYKPHDAVLSAEVPFCIPAESEVVGWRMQDGDVITSCIYVYIYIYI